MSAVVVAGRSKPSACVAVLVRVRGSIANYRTGCRRPCRAAVGGPVKGIDRHIERVAGVSTGRHSCCLVLVSILDSSGPVSTVLGLYAIVGAQGGRRPAAVEDGTLVQQRVSS